MFKEHNIETDVEANIAISLGG